MHLKQKTHFVWLFQFNIIFFPPALGIIIFYILFIYKIKIKFAIQTIFSLKICAVGWLIPDRNNSDLYYIHSNEAICKRKKKRSLYVRMLKTIADANAAAAHLTSLIDEGLSAVCRIAHLLEMKFYYYYPPFIYIYIYVQHTLARISNVYEPNV